VLGIVIGLLIGLAVALGVALYVTKVPVPFVNKVPQRTAEQDAAEAERNKNWDPNEKLTTKVPRPPPAGAAPAVPAVTGSAAPAPAPAGTVAKPARDPAAILAGAPLAAPTTPATPGAASASKPAKPGADPFVYFVQAGAFQRSADAEAQRANLAMLGVEAKVVEREQSGRTVYRVRAGPYDKQPQADGVKDKLAGAGVEAVLVRVERSTNP
jgi:cell division protein FtsN